MEEKDWRIVEYVVEALLILWLGYMFLYQNYLLYNWHRGLPLPSKWPFFMIALGIALLFLAYEIGKLEKKPSPETKASPEPVERVPDEDAGEPMTGEIEETEEEEIRASAPESPQEP